jgi:hypothetical protein
LRTTVNSDGENERENIRESKTDDEEADGDYGFRGREKAKQTEDLDHASDDVKGFGLDPVQHYAAGKSPDCKCGKEEPGPQKSSPRDINSVSIFQVKRDAGTYRDFRAHVEEDGQDHHGHVAIAKQINARSEGRGVMSRVARCGGQKDQGR